MKVQSRWLRLGVAVLALLLAGIIYAWSFLKAPLAALYGWAPNGSQLQLNYTLTLCFFCLGGLISGYTAKRIPARVRMVAGAALVAVGFAIVSRLDGTSAFMLYLGYGVLAGLGIGIVYNTVIAVTNAWFPDKKGLASGCMMMGFGFSAMVLGNLATRLFETGMGWRGTFLLYGLGIGVCLALIGLTVRLPREGEVSAAAVSAASDGEDLSTGAMLRRPSFWMLFAVCTIMCAVGSTAIAQSRDFMGFIDAGAATLAMLGASMVSVMNGVGRLLAGALFDRIGLRRTQYVNNVVLVLAPLTMLLALVAGSAWLGFIGLCLSGVAYGFSPVVTTTFTMAFYGRKHFAMNFPVLTLTLIPASFAPTIAGQMTFMTTYAVLLALAAVGAAVNMFIKKA